MAKTHSSPRISVNKLGEYITSKANRQRNILYDQKYPADYITAYYKDAEEAISLFIAKGMADLSILENRIQSLGQEKAEKIWQQRRALGNIDAIETFMNIMDDLDLDGAAPALGGHQPPKLMIRNVEVSVRPEVTLVRKGLVGGIKLHFPKTSPLSADSAGYITATTQMFCDAHLASQGAADHRLCSVVDLASGAVYAGAKAIKQRKKDIDAACDQIFNLWPTINP